MFRFDGNNEFDNKKITYKHDSIFNRKHFGYFISEKLNRREFC